MLISRTLLTIVFFVFGSSLALANSSHMFTGQEKGAQTNQQKVDILESKIKELEARIDKHLPSSSFETELARNPYDPEMVKKMASWSSTDHLREASTYHQRVKTLEQKKQSLNDRIDRFNQKPYLDTKGLKRDSLRRIKGSLVQDLREAKVRTAWHKAQAEKIMLSESGLHNPQQNS